MIRRINFTGRKKIEREHIRIKLVRQSDGPLRFEAEISLGNYLKDIPADAEVFIEAYYHATFMRFRAGSVRETVTCAGMLTNLPRDTGTVVFFRIKIVDIKNRRGMIVAHADRIRPDITGKRPLLPVNYVEEIDGKNQLWRVNFALTHEPVLEINTRLLEGMDPETFVRSGLFLGMVLPAVLREILTRALLTGDAADFEDDDVEENWKAGWIKYATRRLGVNLAPHADGRDDIDIETKLELVEDAVTAFCNKFCLGEKIRSKLLEEK